MHVASTITGDAKSLSFAVLHFGDQNITAAVKAYADTDAAAFEAFAAEAAGHVQRADFPEVIRQIDRFYGHADFSITSLFRDEQRRIVGLILESTLGDIENSLTTIYQDHASLIHFLTHAGLPKPSALTLAAGFRRQRRLASAALERNPIDGAQMRSTLAKGHGRSGSARDGHALLHRRSAHEARHGGRLPMSSGSLKVLDRALALARAVTGVPLSRLGSLAGAEHLV